MTFGDKVAGILDDQEKAVPKWAALLAEIMEDLTRLECGLVEMKMECVFLESAGMWPAVPTEMWEPRNGSDPIYLRLYFPHGTLGVRTKTYIGCKPENVADARRKSANRQRWEELDAEVSRLERTLSAVEMALNRQRLVVSMRPLPDLGTEHRGAGAAGVTKMEGK